MADWKKDIKLSDLFARNKEKSLEPAEEQHLDRQPEHQVGRDEPAPQDAALEEAEELDAAEEPARPFWKRELTFGRRSDTGDEPEAEADSEPVDEQVEQRPFFKREISFRRQEDELGPEADLDPLEEQATGTPFWRKRGVTFGRRRDDDVRDPEFDEPAEPAEEPERPFWKRELSFGRRKDDVWPDAPDPVAEQAPDEAEETAEAEARPFWKREFSFRLGRGDAPADEGLLTEEASFGTLDEDEKPPFWKRRLNFGREADPDFEMAPTKSERRPFFKRVFAFRRSTEADPAAPDSDPGTETRPRSFLERVRALRSTDRPAEAPAVTPEKTPFFKRQLSLRRGGRTAETVGATPAKAGRRKQVVGLKIGASQIAAARVANDGAPELVQLARQPLEHGIVVGGELRDGDALAEALRDFFARHKLPNRNIRLGIGNNRIGVRSFEIAGVHDPKQLENAVRFRAQEALPIPIDEAVLDYHVIDEAVSPTGIRTYRVLLVVAYRELVDRYIAACRGAGLRLIGIDLEAFALLRALAPPPSEAFPDDTALVAVAIGHDRSTFAVSNGTICEFTRVLDWGGSSLNTAIARSLDITPSQAEPVKRTLTLSPGGDGATPSSNEHTARAEEAVRLELQTFARELVSSLHFYQNQPGSLAIGTIVLTGGTAHLPGLAAELQRLIGVKVRVGDPLRRMKVGNRVEPAEQLGSLAIAIGLGIED